MALKVRKCFHAVGNGTLFTGQIHTKESRDIFNWMYDCGSTSKTTILSIITDLPNWFRSQNVIDMLVISHFDNDHVNGLEALLQTYSVRRLVLPFTEWPQSIREITVMKSSPSVALLQINPLKWLEVNDFIGKVDEILLVEGDGGPKKTDSPLDNPDDDSPQRMEYPAFDPEFDVPDDGIARLPEDNQEFSIDNAVIKNVFFELGNQKATGSIRVAKIHQSQSVYSANNSFEFMFYNAVKPFSALGLVYESNGQIYAKASKMLISDVKAEIETTIISLGLHQGINGSASLPIDWRKTLKASYQKHFGNTGEAKNNISLCMYAAAALKKSRDFGTLFTGDINLTLDVIKDMQAHFGKHRWSSLIGVQVPHHGSQHSWAADNASQFNLEKVCFIQCATPTTNHPHEKVIQDLKKYTYQVCLASRKSPVSAYYGYR